MGFLSKLFSRGLTRDMWYVKINLLTELSEIARKHWIDEWTGADHAVLPPATVESAVAVRISPEADVTFRTFQAHLTISFLAQHEYLPRTDQGPFANQLLGKMVGDRTPEAVELLARYSEEGQGSDDAFRRFAFDIAAALRGMGARSAAGEKILPTLHQFALEQHYITALCFGDTPTVKVLKAQIEMDPDHSPE
jgi:hypothetical protein